MPNAYTGDFDVVAEFSIPAVNRLLAAMHQTERLLHSVSMRVNDNPLPGPRQGLPVVAGVVDAFGDAVANQEGIGTPNPSPGPAAVTDAVLARQDPIVNAGSGSFIIVPIVPSHLQGKAQMQLFPPTVDVPDGSGENLALRLNAMARYFPDPGTAPLAEFIRGDLQIIAPVNQIRSRAANVVEIDFKASQTSIAFTPSYSSQPLTIDDVAGINLLIRNALVTSFQPSSATLPAGVADVQFKTLLGSPKAIAVLLNMSVHAAGSASVTDVFLSGADDFAYAASREFALSSLQPIVNNFLSQPFPPAKFSVNLGLTTLHFTYPITIESAAFDLQSGKIVMTVAGHAGQSNHSWAGPFDFTVTMDFSLAPAGTTVALVSGSISVDASSLLAELVDYFTGALTSAIASARDTALQQSGAAATVAKMFDTNQNLGNFLNSLLVPSVPDAPPLHQRVELLYDRVDIEPAAIVLHGSLLLYGWPAPYVEYQTIPSSPPAGPLGDITTTLGGDGPDYSAFLSWIPGGTIGQYEWSIEGLPSYPFHVDQHKFVLIHSGPVATTGPVAAVSSTSAPSSGVAVVGPSGPAASDRAFVPPAYSPICLTVRGTRIAPAGPAVYQPVSGSICGYTRLPVIAAALASSAGFAPPALPVTRPGPAGEVLVTGHTTAVVARNASEAPSVLVHFADAKSATQVDLLTKALAQSGRSDAPVAVVAVVPADQLARIRYTQRVIYAEDAGGAWERLYGVTDAKRPLTLIVGRQGETVWKHQGPVDRDALAAALARTLVGGAAAPLSVPLLHARIGQPAPDFLFEYARGHALPLRKLAGQPVVLVFWRSSSPPSIRAVLEAERTAAGSAVVLAVNDGESVDHARAAAGAHGVTAVVVVDPKREISRAYGVTLWPTILTLDDAGTITAIGYGHAPAARGGESR